MLLSIIVSMARYLVDLELDFWLVHLCQSIYDRILVIKVSIRCVEGFYVMVRCVGTPPYVALGFLLALVFWVRRARSLAQREVTV